MEWNDANNYCKINHGTTLGTITNANEQNKINTLYGNDTLWFGFNKNNDNIDQYIWESGVVTSYTNWINGNSSINNNDCVTTNQTWTDHSCDNKFGFICDDGMIYIYFNRSKVCFSIYVCNIQKLRMILHQ